MVGSVADPTRPIFRMLTVGRATVPASFGCISGCELGRDHTPQPGLRGISV